MKFKSRVLLNKQNGEIVIQQSKKIIMFQKYAPDFGVWCTVRLFNCNAEALKKNFTDLGKL